MIAFILSDIINSPLEYIASGPTIPQELDTQYAFSILSKYENQLSKVSAVLSPMLTQSQRTITQQSVQTDVNNVLIGNIEVALQSAADTARALGYDTHVWSSDIHGEASIIADLYSNICKIIITKNHDPTSTTTGQINSLPLSHLSLNKLETIILTHCNSPKLCLISGGEPTVTVKGNGKGGRNQELALALAKATHDCGVFSDKNLIIKFASVGTDGQDGPTDAAGAVIDNQTWSTALNEGLNPLAALENNDSYNLLSNLSGDHLIKIGLTGTNVMDIHILLIEF